MTKIEEVARAMAAKRLELIDQPLARIWQDLAIAAISAMREPNEEMMEVATDTSHWGSRICYRAMIDSALAEHKPAAMCCHCDAILVKANG